MFYKSWTWTILGIAALLFRLLAAKFPEGTEAIYSRSIFPEIRVLFDLSLSRLPFPSFYLFLLVIMLILVFFSIHWRKMKGWKMKTRYLVRSVFNFLGFVVFSFLILWGYNYQRISIIHQLSLLPVPLDQEMLYQEVLQTKGKLSEIRQNLTSDTLAFENSLPYIELEDLVRSEIQANLYRMGLKSRGFPRTKEFFPAGFLRKMGIMGIYFPFTGESYIDPSLHPLEKPFTVAHEMAHSYGVTNEGEANFTAWVICSNSNSHLLRYAAELKLFRYQLKDLSRSNRIAYDEILANLEEGIRNDIASIIKHAEQIKPISGELSRKSNDLFLKTQGIGEGVKSYAQLPMLVYAWRNRKPAE